MASREDLFIRADEADSPSDGIPSRRACRRSRQAYDKFPEEARGGLAQFELSTDGCLVLRFHDFESQFRPLRDVALDEDPEVIADRGRRIGEEKNVAAIGAGFVAEESLAHAMRVSLAPIAGDDSPDARHLIRVNRDRAAADQEPQDQGRRETRDALESSPVHFLDDFFFVERAALMRSFLRSR